MDDIFSDSSFLFRFRINNQPPLTTTSKCLGANKPTKSNKIRKHNKLHQHLRMTRRLPLGGKKGVFSKANSSGFNGPPKNPAVHIHHPTDPSESSCWRLGNFHPTLQFPRVFQFNAAGVAVFLVVIGKAMGKIHPGCQGCSPPIKL